MTLPPRPVAAAAALASNNNNNRSSTNIPSSPTSNRSNQNMNSSTSLDSHESGLRPTNYKDLIRMQHYLELREKTQSDWDRIEIDESGCAVTKKLEYGTYLADCDRVI